MIQFFSSVPWLSKLEPGEKKPSERKRALNIPNAEQPFTLWRTLRHEYTPVLPASPVDHRFSVATDAPDII